MTGAPPQPLPQSAEKYVTPSGETKEKSQTPSIAPMIQSLRHNEGDQKPDEHKVVPPLIRADFTDSIVNISSDDTPMEIDIQFQGTPKAEVSVPTPVVCLSPVIPDNYIPGKRSKVNFVQDMFKGKAYPWVE
jgi:hypothetical protein